MFTTRNIAIAVGAIIALALIIWFVSKPRKKSTISISTTEGEVEIEVPNGRMTETEAAIDLNKISFHTPLAVRTDEFPLRVGSKGERVRRFQNYLQSQYRQNYNKLFDFAMERNGENSYWGNNTSALAYKLGVKDNTITQDQYNILRINQFAKPD